MMTVVKQNINAVLMYIYLIYYTNKLRNNRGFMIREALKYRADLKLGDS